MAAKSAVRTVAAGLAPWPRPARAGACNDGPSSCPCDLCAGFFGCGCTTPPQTTLNKHNNSTRARQHGARRRRPPRGNKHVQVPFRSHVVYLCYSASARQSESPAIVEFFFAREKFPPQLARRAAMRGRIVGTSIMLLLATALTASGAADAAAQKAVRMRTKRQLTQILSDLAIEVPEGADIYALREIALKQDAIPKWESKFPEKIKRPTPEEAAAAEEEEEEAAEEEEEAAAEAAAAAAEAEAEAAAVEAAEAEAAAVPAGSRRAASSAQTPSQCLRRRQQRRLRAQRPSCCRRRRAGPAPVCVRSFSLTVPTLMCRSSRISNMRACRFECVTCSSTCAIRADAACQPGRTLAGRRLRRRCARRRLGPGLPARFPPDVVLQLVESDTHCDSPV